MEQVHLKYGTSAVDFEVDGAKSVKYLYENKMRVIEDIKAEFLHCVTDGVIGTKPLKELIAPTDPVTIVISDMTRFWMRRIWYTSVRRPSERVYRSIRWQSAERSSASAVRCTI